MVNDFKEALRPSGSSFNASFLGPERDARSLTEVSDVPSSELTSKFTIGCTITVPFSCNCHLTDCLPERRLSSIEFLSARRNQSCF